VHSEPILMYVHGRFSTTILRIHLGVSQTTIQHPGRLCPTITPR